MKFFITDFFSKCDQIRPSPAPPRRLFNFEALALGCGAYWRAVLKRGASFNARGMIWKKKIENFVIFSFQTTINNFHYDI